MMRKNSKISKMLVWLVAVVLCLGLVKMDTYAASSTLKIAGQSEPSKITQGKSFDCKGVITSNYKLTNVTGKITTSSGSVKYQKSVNPSSKKAVYKYSLLGNAIDCSLLFNKLPAGSYKYIIIAKDSSGTTKTLVNKSFNIVANASTLKISGNKAITSLKAGNAWTCNGTISSNYKITQVYGAILKSDGVSRVYHKTDKPNAKSYSLAGKGIDKALLFNKLPVGTYYYVVDATDASGKKLNLVKNKFTVQGNTSTLKISGNKAISSLKSGKAWTCNGTISSNYKITEVYGAILESDGVSRVYHKTDKPNAKKYSLAGNGIDKALLFNKLPAGTYYYVVDAKDESGKKLNLIKNKFTVEAEKSTLKISGNKAITSLVQGKKWTCNGTISSNYKITGVCGEILKADGVTPLFRYNIKPDTDTKSLKLEKSIFARKLEFNKLTPGVYYYVVNATDASGKKLTVVKNKFFVKSANSKLKISGNTAITSIMQGKSWKCNGTISSNYKVTQVYGAILKADGVTPVYRKTINPNVKSVKLADTEIAKILKFDQLPSGTYYYVVDATDSTGTVLNLVKNKFTVKAKDFGPIVGKSTDQILNAIKTRNSKLKPKNGDYVNLCGAYVKDKLEVMGCKLTSGAHGKEWYGNLKSGKMLSNNYCAEDLIAGENALRTLVNRYPGESIYNVVVSFSGGTAPAYGHVVLIDCIRDGKVYYSEMYTEDMYKKAQVKTIDAFMKHYTVNQTHKIIGVACIRKK